MKLFETNAFTALSLSETQKELLTKIFSAPDIPEQMGKKIELTDDHQVTARNMLQQMGAISIDPETELVTMTPKGIEIMKEENLLDETDQLTSVGQEYSTRSDVQNSLAQPGNPGASGDMAGMPDTGDKGAGGSPMPNGPVVTMGFAAYLKANSTILN
jgi:hypothetical protein